MLCGRHRGFPVMFCFSDVKGNITLCCIAFSRRVSPFPSFPVPAAFSAVQPLFPSRKKSFSVFPFPKKTAKKAPSGCKNQPSHARIVGFCQFQNLSIGEMHKVFLRPSGASALNFHAQKSAEKNFVSKEPRKSAFLHRRFRSCSAAKTCAILVLPSGEAPNRTERRHGANSSGHG